MVAFDGVNMCREPLFDTNLLWYQMMDGMRKVADNNRSTIGKRARTYTHFIISCDPRGNIGLDEFRSIVTAWGEKFFDDSKLGSYDVAIIYLNDNMERRERGEEGILHAHIIVNNTDLKDGKRIAPKLTRRIINDMYFEINKAALAAGYHAFATNGKSYTQREMVELGLNPSRNRNDANVSTAGSMVTRSPVRRLLSTISTPRSPRPVSPARTRCAPRGLPSRLSISLISRWLW